MAGALLGHLLGPLQPRVAARGQLVRFNQSRFWPAGSKACNATCSKNGDCPCTGMFHDGLVYIPTRCSVADIPPPNWCGGGCDPHNRTANPPPVANGSIRDCKIHVVYPGCGCCINEGPAGYDIPKYAGFNEHAESNDIIVLYPQQDGGGIPNPCWDSIKDPNQANRKGLQMNVVNRMVDWLGGAAAATPTRALKTDESSDAAKPCPPQPCSSHPGVTFCSSLKTAGQCEKPMPHPPCPPCLKPPRPADGSCKNELDCSLGAVFHTFSRSLVSFFHCLLAFPSFWSNCW